MHQVGPTSIEAPASDFRGAAKAGLYPGSESSIAIRLLTDCMNVHCRGRSTQPCSTPENHAGTDRACDLPIGLPNERFADGSGSTPAVPPSDQPNEFQISALARIDCAVRKPAARDLVWLKRIGFESPAGRA